MTETPAYSDAYKIALINAAATIKAADPHSWALPSLIAILHNSVADALQPAPAVEPEPERKPVVSARASVTPDAVTCMACGFVGKSIKRHIFAKHGQTVEQYREYWGLKEGHPIVAPNYSAMRSQLAKQNGLGRKA